VEGGCAADQCNLLDVGGVLLTNAWDRSQREAALEHFKLDEEEFADRTKWWFPRLSVAKSADDYLDRTVFYRARPFSRDEFKQYIFPYRSRIPSSDVCTTTGRL